jgi:cell division protein FtsB
MTDDFTDEPAPDSSDDSAEEPFEETFEDAFDETFEDTFEEPAEETTAVPTDARAGLAVDAESMAQVARRMVWAPRTRIAVASLALVAMMFVFVFPTRSYLAQKRQIGKSAHAVEVLEAQNEVLARQASRLQTRSEIERLAREQFNMVMPGEQAYNVVETPGSPADTTTTTVP